MCLQFIMPARPKLTSYKKQSHYHFGRPVVAPCLLIRTVGGVLCPNYYSIDPLYGLKKAVQACISGLIPQPQKIVSNSRNTQSHRSFRQREAGNHKLKRVRKRDSDLIVPSLHHQALNIAEHAAVTQEIAG